MNVDWVGVVAGDWKTEDDTPDVVNPLVLLFWSLLDEKNELLGMKLPDFGIDGRNLLKASELQDDALGLTDVKASFKADLLSPERSITIGLQFPNIRIAYFNH